MSDEDIIKRKLLIDGDGTGDDRRLNVISKTLRKWAFSPLPTNPSTATGETDASQDTNQLTYDKLLAQLSVCEYSVRRANLLSRTTKKQLETYKTTYSSLEQQIIDVKDAIRQCKQNLVEAKVWKQNHMQYDLMAQSIFEQPARADTMERLNRLKDELNDLHKERQQLEDKLEARRRQFHVLLTSATRLQELLEENGESCEMEKAEVVTHFLDDDIGAEPMSE